MKTFSVYVITCTVNNKKYVGMTSQEVRKRISNGKKYKGRLGMAVSKYGWSSFTYEVVSSNLSLEEAKDLEERLISELKSNVEKCGFNQTKGGECRFIGHRQTESTRKRISDSMKSREFSDEHKHRISKAKSGVMHHFAKPVYQYKKDGTFIRQWAYMSEAANELGIKKTCISAACLGKIKSSGGYIWSYEPLGETAHESTDI